MNRRLTVMFFFILPTMLALAGCGTLRVSVSESGGDANGRSEFAVVSANGRYVAFESEADNLVANDTNGQVDAFVRDMLDGATSLVSVSSLGAQGDDLSDPQDISADGRYVAFISRATNLVPNDTNGAQDIFVRDIQDGKTTRVSIATGGTEGNDTSNGVRISDDGRYVAFYSWATNLVAGDTNGQPDVFVHDRQTGTTERVSVATGGGQANDQSRGIAISGDGRYVAFRSWATNLVPGDTNGEPDIFVHDRQTGATERVSVATGGGQSNGESSQPALSADGRYVAFDSVADNLVPGDSNDVTDVFVHDRQTGVTERVSVSTNDDEGNDASSEASISADGSQVAFDSWASNLVPGDANGALDVFVRDRSTHVTARISINFNDGGDSNDGSYDADISANGRYVVFTSDATNIVYGDNNGLRDVFIHDRYYLNVFLPVVLK